MPQDEQNLDWFPILVRCLACLCLQNSEYADGRLSQQAGFLKRLGLPAGHIADLLGRSRASSRVQSRSVKKKKRAIKTGKTKLK